MTRHRWVLMRGLEQAGLPGIAAALVLVGCAIAWFGWLAPLQARVQAAQQGSEVAALRVANARLTGPVARARTPAESLAVFEGGFGGERTLSPTYARLWQLAQRDGLALKRAEFKLSEPVDGALARWGVVVPVTGEYRALRAFVADALREIPSLALEQVEFHRDEAKASQVEARLQFVVFVGKAG